MTDFQKYIPPRGFRVGQAAGLNRTDIPESLRNRFVATFEQALEETRATYPRQDDALDRLIWASLGLRPEDRAAARTKASRYATLATQRMPDVNDFVELIEACSRALLAVAGRVGYPITSVWTSYRDRIREILILDRMGFRLTDDALVVDAGTELENAAVDEARSLLLGDARFVDAEAKFTSALQILARQDTNEYPAASHAAVSALEEVCREILSDESILLDKALDKIKLTNGFDPNIVEAMKKVFHYRGNQAGAAHGAGRASEPETRFVVHLVAAAMIALVSATTSPR